MLLKSLISKNNLVNLIDPIIYVANIVIAIIILIFINKNVYQTMTIQDSELKNMINEAPKNINNKEFNEIINKINSKKNKQQSIVIREIF